MFKKLKDKIAEEVKQSPMKITASVQQLAQAVVSPNSSSVIEPASNDHFSIGEDSEETPQNSPSKGGFQSVELQEASPVPHGAGRSRRSSISSVTSDTSSLFPRYETPGNSFHLQSDIESASEVEDSINYQLDRISKEQLLSSYKKMQVRYNKYKGRYADLARHYRELDRENVKAKTILTDTQDKALRRMAELKEQCQLEQRAKAHLEEALRNDLEEKDHLINTLQTKIQFLKASDSSDDLVVVATHQNTTEMSNSSENLLIDLSADASPSKLEILPDIENALQEKIRKQELLLSKCEESILIYKEQITILGQEKQEMHEGFESHKASSSSQLSLLTEDLTTARQEILSLSELLNALRKREEEAALSLAENKLIIHRELEAKEEQIKSLNETLQQITHDKNELMGKTTSLHKEVLELQQGASVENGMEEDKQSLIQELSRGKAEAIKLLRQEMQKNFNDLEMKMGTKLHKAELEVEHLLEELKQKNIQLDEANIQTNPGQIELLEQKEQEVKDLKKIIQNVKLKCSELENKNIELLEFQKNVADKDIQSNVEHEKQVICKNQELLELTTNYDKLLQDNTEIKEMLKLQEIELEEKVQKIYFLEKTKVNDTAEYKQLEHNYKEAGDKCRGFDQDMKGLESILQEKDQELRKLSQDAAGVEGRIALLEQEALVAKEQCLKLVDEKKILMSCLNSCLKDLSEMRNFSYLLKSEYVNSFKEMKDNINKASVIICKSMEKLKHDISEKDDKLIAAQKLCTERENNETELRERLTKLNESFLTQREEFLKLTQGNSDENLKIKYLQESKQSLEFEVSENKTVITKLNNELRNTLQAVVSKEEGMSIMMTKMKHLETQLEKKDIDIEALVAKHCQDFAGMKESYCELMKCKEVELNILSEKYREKCMSATANENQIAQIKIDFQTVSKECEALHINKKQMENKLTELTETLNIVNSKKDELAKKSNKEVAKLAQKVKQLTATLNALQVDKLALEADIAGTSNKLSETIKENHEMITKLEAVTEHKQSLEVQIDDLTNNISVYKQERDVLHTEANIEKEQFTSEKCGYENQLKEFEDRLVGLRGDNNRLMDELEAVRFNSQDTHQELSKILEDTQTKLKVSIEEKEILEMRLLGLESQHSEVDTEITRLNGVVAQQETKWKTRKKEWHTVSEAQKEQLKDVTTKLGNVQKELEMSQALVQTLSVKLEENENFARNSVEKLECKVKEKEMALNESAVKLKHLLVEKENLEVETLKEKEKILLNVKEENLKYLDHIKELELKVHCLETEKVKFESSISNCNAELEQLRAGEIEFQQLKDSFREVESQAFNLKQEYETQSRSVNLLTLRNEELSVELDCLKKNQSNSKREIDKICSEKCNLEEALSSEIERSNTLNDTIESLNKQLTQLSSMVTSTDSEKKQSDQLIQQLKTDNERERNQNEKHSRDLESLKQEVDHLHTSRLQLDQDLSIKDEKMKECNDLMLKVEELKLKNSKLEAQLDETLLTFQAKENQISELEDAHNQKIKQLVKDFEMTLAKNEEEMENLEAKSFDQKELEENHQMKQLREQVRELRVDVAEQGEAYERLVQDHKASIMEKQVEVSSIEQRLNEVRAAHNKDLSEADKRWRQCLERELANRDVRHNEEIAELSKEWHWERKTQNTESELQQPEELENTSQLAVAAVESGTGSIELLHKQLVSTTQELQKTKRQYRLAKAELGKLVSTGGKGVDVDMSNLEDATELEYLRNILYEYMMGKEPMVLARVIAAVVKFDAEQTDKVLQKEEHKQTLLGQLGIM